MNTSVRAGADLSEPNLGKYDSRNFIVRRLIDSFSSRVAKLVSELEPKRVFDLGCGEGFIARKLHQRDPLLQYLGVDRSELMLGRARALNPTLNFIHEDFLRFDVSSTEADVFLCLEVLEHQLDPEIFLSKLSRFPMKAALISVPWEPFYRIGNFLRGRYLSRWGNHPEHIQHFTPASVAGLIARHFKDVKTIRSFPWIIVVATNRSRDFESRDFD